jgi:catechol 2,3-dioxygenase-like lactoylglutathione lyase family enzyme
MIKTVWSITFYVSDLARAKKFYSETLGLEKKYEYPSYVGFECGGVEIGLIPRLKKGQKVGPSSPPIEFLVDDAQKVYDELRKKGVEFTKELHEEQWGGRQATFTDPDGNTLEIVQVDWEKYFAVSAEGAKKKQ